MKKALVLVREKKHPVAIFKELEEQGKLDFDWKKVFEIFKKPDVDKGLKIKFGKLDAERVKKILVEEHDFSLERISNGLEKLNEVKKGIAQQRLF